MWEKRAHPRLLGTAEEVHTGIVTMLSCPGIDRDQPWNGAKDSLPSPTKIVACSQSIVAQVMIKRLDDRALSGRSRNQVLCLGYGNVAKPLHCLARDKMRRAWLH